MAKTRAAVARLSVEARPDWIGGRIFTLLSHYYVSELPPAVNKKIGEDWKAELKGLPGWAITLACRWWLSQDNPKRGKKPMPGDISARVKVETGIVRMGVLRLSQYERYGKCPPAFIGN